MSAFGKFHVPSSPVSTFSTNLILLQMDLKTEGEEEEEDSWLEFEFVNSRPSLPAVRLNFS